MAKIQDRIYKLKKVVDLGGNLRFVEGEELHIVMDMVMNCQIWFLA